MTQQHALATVLDQDTAIRGVKVLAAIVRELRESVFVAGSDYGTIPGTNDKPVLLLPGMEKLMRALRLRAEYVEREKTVNWESNIFYFEYEARLIEVDTDLCVSTAIGSANSRETKWRWRDAKRKCPVCGMETINKSKDKPEWYCWKKIQGCGATFPERDERIASQQVGRIENPDIADQVNTICKIAQKRALASAIKGAANVSEFFTVDLDDIPSFNVQVRPENIVDATFKELLPAQPKNGVKPTQQATETHWTSQQNAVNDFFKWGRELLELKPQGLFDALTVASGSKVTNLTQWSGTEDEAKAACIAAYLKYDKAAISAYTSTMAGRDDFKFEINNLAQKYAETVEFDQL